MSASCAAGETVDRTYEDWARREFGRAGLGDTRLDERLVRIAAAFMAAPQASIPRASGGWAEAKATYRFLDNKNVEPEVIYARHRESILPRAKGEPVVLAIADTTMLDYTSHPETAGLGPLSDLVHHGMLFHPTLLLTPQRVPLGVIDAQTWVRDVDTFGSSNENPKRGPEEKESGKWLASLEAAESLQRDLGEATKVVSVFDREGDTYDVLATARLEGWMGQILVRAKSDRRLAEEEQNRKEEGQERDEHNQKLWNQLEAEPVAATVGIEVPRKKGQITRTANLSLRFAQVTVRAPTDRPKSEGNQPVEVYAVYAHEDSPPKGIKPVSWMLLTTVTVESVDDAWTIVQWYSARWMIEILFKVLKTGCTAEERQLETAERLKRCLAVDVVVAWRILYLTMVGRDTPDLPCTVVFEDYEWKALWVFVFRDVDAPPAITPTLREVIRTIGRMGGHLGRKGDGEPGILTMWRGLQRLPDIAAVWQVCEARILHADASADARASAADAD